MQDDHHFKNILLPMKDNKNKQFTSKPDVEALKEVASIIQHEESRMKGQNYSDGADIYYFFTFFTLYSKINNKLFIF
jgi:hypothetical protein